MDVFLIKKKPIQRNSLKSSPPPSSWSEEGCRVSGGNHTHVRCQCSHLTNFAVLMDLHSTALPPAHAFALSIVTCVGCLVSIVCLVLAIVIFHVLKRLQVNIGLLR